MYTPSHFEIRDPDTIRSFIRNHNFGVMISGAALDDTQLPFLVSDDLSTLNGHIAKANPQWKAWKQQSLTRIVFQGPHNYISPSYYRSGFSVPTWNYTSVSVLGEVQIIDEFQQKNRILHDLVAFHEATLDSPWTLDESDARYLKLFDAIVFFEVRISKIEAKFKLNQNKSSEDRASVIQRLR